MKRGLLIVFEGVDSSGKKTQVSLLEDRLKRLGFSVETMSYPTYDSCFGKLVASYLRGEFGSLTQVPAEVAALLFSLDRYQFKDKMLHSLRKGTIILSDRYTQSNMGFQGVKFKGKERWEFINWIEKVESRLPQPDLVIFLDMPVEVAQILINNKKRREYLKGMKKDIHEKDVEFQKKVRKVYLELAKRKKWVIIKCAEKVKGEWKVKPPEVIHEEILDVIKNILHIF